MSCPCGTEKSYAECCEPVVKGDRAATTAEELMRARYTAYTKVELDFLHESLHPDHREGVDPEGSREWAENAEWHSLEVLKTSAGGPEDEQGKVEFVATYTLDGDMQRYHEQAEFDKIKGNWYFREGVPGVRQPIVREEPKIGRNDPCSCGSGKKYKKCCGR
ncbi:MAG: SEC-C motif-containing protein [Candidatus Krumholzibacteriia bacterium]|jgi:SEC-C motif-containing protein